MPGPSRLPLGLSPEALAAAGAEPDPESLAASVRLRQRYGPDLAAAAVTQVVLRRRAVAKFGDAAAAMFFTREGLEQATRPAVAERRAARIAATGARRVVDLGCGIGTDAVALVRAGLEVIAVDRDPLTADVAQANLLALGAGRFEVVTGGAEESWPALALALAGTAVFCDPARRTDRGRSWRVEDLSPPWPFLIDILDGSRPGAVKLGPGLPTRLIPETVEAEWISSRRDTVELTLWAGHGATPRRRSAAVVETASRLVTDPAVPEPPVDLPQRYLYEPLGAVIRSGGLPTLAAALDATALHPDIAYLTSAENRSTEFASAFAIRSVFPFRERLLRDWVRREDVGTLEIKTRGLGVDPAELRRRLKLRGRRSAVVVLTRTRDGPRVLVVDRLDNVRSRSSHAEDCRNSQETL